MGEPEHRIEQRRTGDPVPACAVYMTTREEDAGVVDGVEMVEVVHYFRVPVDAAAAPLGFGARDA